MNEYLELKEEVTEPYLIQRLKSPVARHNPFSFGGGLKNGGLSDDAMSLISTIFSFDYMGSAEFEFGAVPTALQFIADQVSQGNIVWGTTNGVFYLCPLQYEDGVKDIISQLLIDEHKFGLKERCGLMDSIQGQNGYSAGKGWLELKNGYMFFIDEKMFNETKILFGLE